MKLFTTLRTAQVSTIFSQRTIRLAALGLVAGFGLAAGSPAHAQEVRTKSDAESMSLTVENPTQQRVQVQVLQVSSQSMLSNEVNHQFSYGTKLNFAKLPAGEYAVLVRVGRERYRYAVQVQAAASISVREVSSPAADKAVASAAL